MAQFGILTSFDHISQSLPTYKGRLNQWFIANDVEKDVKKRAVLLSALNDGTYKLASDLALPKDLQQVPYEQIVNLLDNHFIPKRKGFGDRYNFYTAVQDDDESFAQWAARLRGLTANCNFQNVEEALRDRFLMGMRPGTEQEKLFAQDIAEVTLAKAVEIADSVRNARAATGSAVAAAQAGEAAPAAQLFKIAKKPKNSVQCKVCGLRNHLWSECRYSNYKCKKCHKKGHLRRMCTQINFVENEGTLVEPDDDGELFQICSHAGEPMTVVVLVEGFELKFQIDSGSAVTAISDADYRKFFENVPLINTKKRLYSYTGTSIKSLGVVRLNFTYGEITHTLNVFVIHNGGPPLLGRDFIAKFNLQMLSMNYCDKSYKLLEQLQSCYPKVFSDELGKFKLHKVKLHLKENAKPIFIKARPVPYALKDKVDIEIDRLIQLGILKPVSYAEYASPIVPVLKRNGSIRLCADYSGTINKQLKVDQYPLPTAQELFAKLHGGRLYSKLDLSQAYSQLELDDESQRYTCINTHRGLFKFTRLVFGLACAPAIFQRTMECVLSGIDGVLCMLDDILISSVDYAEHVQRLHLVLKKLQDVGLTVQKDKCEFFKDQVEYLGYTINKHGLKKSLKKVEAVMNAPVPNNVNKLQSFLGLVNYYRNFIPNASSMLSPLYDLLQKSTKWVWGKEQHEAFVAVKKCLSSEQVLAHFNPRARVILTVDASPTGLGAVLSQIDVDGVERPVSFASRTLNKAEKNYAQIQKEATAIIFGVRRFHQYLYGRSEPFILRTDHKPLLSIFGPHRGIPEVSANRLQRYALFLSAYNYTIEYIRSSENSADYLSRASIAIPQCVQAGDKDGCIVEDRASYVNFVIDYMLLKKVKSYILNGWPPKIRDTELKPFFLCRYELAYENECIMRGHKIVIPTSLRKQILSELHKSHLGICKTKAEARSRFWFPDMDKAIEQMINSCKICIQLRPLPPRTGLAVWRFPPHPFFRIHIDFLGPIFNITYFVIVDAHTKWVEVYKMNSMSTSAVILRLEDFISRFGLPHTLVSDNGTAFISQEFKSFCDSNGISHVTSPAYHPASNGQAESYVKIVKKGIKSSILANKQSCNQQAALLKYLFDYRNSVHSTTGSSPAQLVFGRKLRSRLDLLSGASPSSSGSLADRVRHKQCLQSNKYRGTNKQSFTPGDKVMFKKPQTNNINTWSTGTIMKRLGKVTYIIKDSLTSQLFKKHKNQLWRHEDIQDDKGPKSATDLEEFEGNATLSPGTPTSSQVNQSPLRDRTQPLSQTPNIPPSSESSHEETASVLPSGNQARIRSQAKSLRALPRVNYKPFFSLNL
ncbi:hypothetical protein K1T71_014776 [Dendrolimus kikuchii]|nr:hypothetical protein K1T71_014776 [Dendrolimus kikuchii]